jgi:hypothetical protein
MLKTVKNPEFGMVFPSIKYGCWEGQGTKTGQREISFGKNGASSTYNLN